VSPLTFSIVGTHGLDKTGGRKKFVDLRQLGLHHVRPGDHLTVL
jgi:hypothetical protein